MDRDFASDITWCEEGLISDTVALPKHVTSRTSLIRHIRMSCAMMLLSATCSLVVEDRFRLQPWGVACNDVLVSDSVACSCAST